MERQDAGLAFMLQYENIAWYDNGEVRILDRRIYPSKTEFVVCKTHVEVAKAITDMVTQSAGPFTAAPMGMALAAWECRDMNAERQMEYLKQASYTISHSRPTTTGRMKIVTEAVLPAAELHRVGDPGIAAGHIDRTFSPPGPACTELYRSRRLPDPDLLLLRVSARDGGAVLPVYKRSV